MAETQSHFSDEVLNGPAGPVQPLEVWADDIIAQKGVDYSTETHKRMVATWEDEKGYDLQLEKFVWGVSSVYRLRVSFVGQREPVASFKYRHNMPGVFECDRNWKEIGQPTSRSEEAMYAYLQTAPVTPRHGSPDENVNKAFWNIAAHHVLADAGVGTLLQYAHAQTSEVAQFALVERAIFRMRECEPALPEELIRTVVNAQMEIKE